MLGRIVFSSNKATKWEVLLVIPTLINLMATFLLREGYVCMYISCGILVK